MKQMRDESGQAAILVGLSLVVILGFVGFAADVGVLLHDKRNLQIAADAAAIAGAKEIRISTAQVTTAAYAASAQNGYANGVNGVTVVPSYPAADGPHAGDPAYAEAIVRQTQPGFFMRIFGFASMPVSARAVAFNGATTDTACLTALNSNAPDTIHLQGSFTVNAPGCSVIDNSNNSNALEFTGGAGRITAGGIGVVGGMTGPYGTDSTPVPVTGIQQISDPLAGVIKPPAYNPASCTAAPAAAKKNGPVTWGNTAGTTTCYSGTIKVDSTVTMLPGVYVIPGTLDFSGHGSITVPTPGVTFYIPPGGTFGNNGAGNTTLNLVAPTSGPYNGVVIYQDAANTNDIYLNGTPVVGLTGVIYAPSAQLDLGGNTKVGVTQTYITDFVVGKLYDFGNATLDIQNYTSIVPGSPLTTIALVE